MNVKEEPVSSTNVEAEQRTVDESPEIANVIIKQQRSSPEQVPPPPSSQPSQAIDDFENDPEAGPSGLQTEQTRSNENYGRRLIQYDSDATTEDESGDERAAMWRPQESYRFNRNDEDSGDTRFSSQSWRYDLPAAIEPQVHLDIAPSASNQSEEVIDLSENESVHSNAATHNPPANAPRNLEVLTAPDLQLDWLSDSSSDNEIVCTIRPQTPDRSAALNFTQPTLSISQANDLPAIDLTASDDEEATHPRVYCAGQPGCTRPLSSGERMRLLYENRHNRIANIYLRNRLASRSPNFHNEQRGDR